VLAATLALLACTTTPTDPSETADLVVAGMESGRIAYVSVSAGRIIGYHSETHRSLQHFAFDSARNVAYLYYYDRALAEVGSVLRHLSLRPPAAAWSVPLGTNVRYRVSGGGELSLTADPVAYHPPTDHVIVGVYGTDVGWGIARFDPVSRTILAHRFSWRPYSFRMLERSGYVAATIRTDRQVNRPVLSAALILDPMTLEVVDSISLPPPFARAGVVGEAPDGDRLYLAGDTHLFLYSLAQRRVLASTPRPSDGRFALSPNGQLAVMSDIGRWPDYPGSGKLFVFDQNLQPLGAIDLPWDTPTGMPAIAGDAAFSRNGRWLFVGAGTPPYGPTYGFQRSRVLVLDGRTLAFVKEIPLNDWRWPLLFPLR
jgi:hypothetical protein